MDQVFEKAVRRILERHVLGLHDLQPLAVVLFNIGRSLCQIFLVEAADIVALGDDIAFVQRIFSLTCRRA